MRVCRFARTSDSLPEAGFDLDRGIVPLEDIAEQSGVALNCTDDLLRYLRGGDEHTAACELFRWLISQPDEVQTRLVVKAVRPLVPIPNPPKLLLLAGNYPKHVTEQGYSETERSETFPYVFMKPPTTTMIATGDSVVLPACSPDRIDWEVELGVIIGRTAKNISAEDAMDVIAGYTVINDISDRGYRPNPERRQRERDGFFDWLHGKWHDTFCPIGPCVLSAADCVDPGAMQLRLGVDGVVHQDESTAAMIFSVPQIIEFISRSVTLQPGDVIATGTPSGVGKAKGIFLKPGQVMTAEIEGIGRLVNPVVSADVTTS